MSFPDIYGKPANSIAMQHDNFERPPIFAIKLTSVLPVGPFSLKRVGVVLAAVCGLVHRIVVVMGIGAVIAKAQFHRLILVGIGDSFDA